MMHIHQIVARHLPQTAPALLDDEAALDSVSGDATALRDLRGLLARELEQLERDLTKGDLAANPAELGERLHRLRASCGFCGAIALSRFAAGWQEILRTGHAPANEQRDAFVALCRQTAAALCGG